MPSYNDFADLVGGVGMSPDERMNWREGLFEAVREIECDWTDRVAVYNSLINTAYPYIGGTGAYVRGGRMRGWGKSSKVGSQGMVAYEKAKITLFYDNRVQYVGGKWVEEELVPSAQFRQLDARSFCWDSSSGKMLRQGEAPHMRQVFLDYSLTFYKLPAIPTAILTHVGACNNAPFASYLLGIVFDTETLILVSPPARRELLTGFFSGLQLTYHFRFQPFGANKFWRAETNQWESVYYRGGTGRYIQHPLMDFTLLFP